MIPFILIHAINMAAKLLYNVETCEDRRGFTKSLLGLQNNRTVHDNSFETKTATCIDYGTRNTY